MGAREVGGILAKGATTAATVAAGWCSDGGGCKHSGSLGSPRLPASISPESALNAAGRLSVTQSTVPVGVRSSSHFSVEWRSRYAGELMAC